MKDRVFYDHSHTSRHLSASKWKIFHQRTGEIPADVRHWLLDEGSLSLRLIKASNNAFSVRVLRQGWSTPVLSERQSLGLSARTTAQIRETLLLCNGEPWVYARSVIPAHTLSGRARCLRQLGTKSLGSWLFREPTMSRHPFEIARLRPDNDLVPADIQGQQTLWGRRSRFEVLGQPLLVAEIFLPAFQAWPIVGG
ncbi:MAG: chorismate lyase [Pseudomonadales bacterium]